MILRGVDPDDLLVTVRTVLLDALEALDEHKAALIVIGAQAVHLRTGDITVALAETTKDSDVALDSRALRPDPRIEAAMRAAGFVPSDSCQPGSWVNAAGVPVDLMVPEKLAGPGKTTTRGARLPPHDNKALRRAKGLEAAVIDNDEMPVPALDPADGRVRTVRVAGAAALLVAKMHKLSERRNQPHRLNDKDAHDAYRLLVAVETEDLREKFMVLLGDDISAEVTEQALAILDEWFAAGPDAVGSSMAGRAEEGVGDPEGVATAVSILACDLIDSLRSEGLDIGMVDTH